MSPQKICPVCSQAAPIANAFCGKCGHPFRTQFDPSYQTRMVTAPPVSASPMTSGAAFHAPAAAHMAASGKKRFRLHPVAILGLVLFGIFLLGAIYSAKTEPYQKHFGPTSPSVYESVPLGVSQDVILDLLGLPSFDSTMTLFPLDKFPSLRPDHAPYYFWFYYTTDGGQITLGFEHDHVIMVGKTSPDGKEIERLLPSVTGN